jgi:hypothetical protein
MKGEKILPVFITLFMGGLLFWGHIPVYSPSIGVMITDVNSPITITSESPGSKKGEATASTVLGLISSGDASINTAARNGKITKIMTVTCKSYNILGIFARFTTTVTGE